MSISQGHPFNDWSSYSKNTVLERYLVIQDKWKNFIEQEGVKFNQGSNLPEDEWLELLPKEYEMEEWIGLYVEEHKHAETEDCGLGGEEEHEVEMMEWLTEAGLYTVEDRNAYLKEEEEGDKKEEEFDKFWYWEHFKFHGVPLHEIEGYWNSLEDFPKNCTTECQDGLDEEWDKYVEKLEEEGKIHGMNPIQQEALTEYLEGKR